MADNARLSAALDGIPMVADAAAREARFPIATRSQDQRVFNKATGSVERWSGSSWIADTVGYPLLAGELNVTDLRFPVGDVRRYGALAGGTTDATAAFQAAASSGSLLLVVPPGTWRVDGQISVAAKQVWYMAGASIVTTGSTITTFNCDTVDGWALVGPFTITGGGSTSGTAKGIRIRDCSNWRILHPRLITIAGHGIYVEPGGSTRARGEGGVCQSPIIKSCYKGWEDVADTGAEYSTIVDPHITGCTIAGLITAAGNTRVVGGHILDNVGAGVQLYSGPNSAHGGFTGVNINHNGTYNLEAHQVTNGLPFVNCNFYQTNIWLDRCKGITFTGGHLSVATIYNDSDGSSGLNVIRGMFCPGGYGDTAIIDTGVGRDQLVVEGCYGPGAYTAGVSINSPGRTYVLTARDIGTSQSLTSGSSATLLFTAKTFDRRLAFNAGTGVFTVPAMSAGVYRIQASLPFSGTSVSPTASYVVLNINGTARALFTPGTFSTTALTVQVAYDIHLSIGDTVSLSAVITATTPTFGHSLFAGYLSIQQIA